jgi:hypothetical protein
LIVRPSVQLDFAARQVGMTGRSGVVRCQRVMTLSGGASPVSGKLLKQLGQPVSGTSAFRR